MSKPLITIVGMGSGISLSVAKRFGKEGFEIAMIARNAEKLENTKIQLAALGYSAHGFQADVVNFDQLKQAHQEIEKALGKTDVLVYNVSVYREADPTAMDAEMLIDDFRANVAAALVTIQAVVPTMKAEKSGTIILTGGGTALNCPPVLSSLGIGKAGIRNLTGSLHRELKPFGIKVGTITVNGAVRPNTKFAPDLICEAFWKFYNDNSDVAEVLFE